MKFERIIDGKDHLWAVRDMNKPNNELAALFQKWNDAEYLWEFFLENQDDLQEFFHIERISEAVEDTIDDAEQLERLILEMPYTDNLDELFHPLGSADSDRPCELVKGLCHTRRKECVRDYGRCN